MDHTDQFIGLLDGEIVLSGDASPCEVDVQFDPHDQHIGIFLYWQRGEAPDECWLTVAQWRAANRMLEALLAKQEAG